MGPCRTSCPSSRQFLVLLLCVLLLSSGVWRVVGLEATWTAASDNEPLPQSAKYRANLRKLCELFATGGRLAPSVDKANLKKLCAKLRKDDENVSSSLVSSTTSRAVVAALGVVGVVMAWQSFGDTVTQFLKQQLRQLLQRKPSSSSINVVKKIRGGLGTEGTDDLAATIGFEPAELLEMRLARLRRFGDQNPLEASS